MPFHPADGATRAAEQFSVAVVQVGQVAPQLFLGGGRTAPRPTEERRVGDQPAPHHDAGQGGKLLFQRVELGGGGHIAVVAHRHGAPGQRSRKGGVVGLSAVLLPHHPGMDGQLRDGVAIINFQNGGKLFRLLHTQPGLDRDRPLGAGEYAVQKGVYLGRIPQHPGALALGGHRPGGTAQIQVHLSIAQRPQLPDHPSSQLAVLRQQLRDDRRTGVCRRGKLCHLLFNEHPVLRRGDKRRIIAVGSALCAEPFLMGLPPDPVCKPLHGGSIIKHGRFSKRFCYRYCSIKSGEGKGERTEKTPPVIAARCQPPLRWGLWHGGTVSG